MHVPKDKIKNIIIISCKLEEGLIYRHQGQGLQLSGGQDARGTGVDKLGPLVTGSLIQAYSTTGGS